MFIRASEIEALDIALADIARSSGVLRLGLAEGLEELATNGGHHELGFPTIFAYALERCERSTRWVQESCALVVRLRELPATRAEVISGRMSFSMAQVVATVARGDDEAQWIAMARKNSVRAMRKLVQEKTDDGVAPDAADFSWVRGSSHLAMSEDEENVALTVTVDREDVFLFERARIVAKSAGVTTLEEVWDALLAEGATSLMASMAPSTAVPFDGSHEEQEERLRAEERAKSLDEAEECAETELRLPGLATERPGTSPATFAFDGDVSRADTELRRIAAALAQRDLELGERAERFWKSGGVRRLGYATASQYARERLGMSLSAVKAKRALARRVRTLPSLKEAMQTGTVGYEAARLVGTVATAATTRAWIDRAQMRTVRHLREEVEAAQMLARIEVDTERWPPSEETMREIAATEARVLAGQLVGRRDAETPESVEATKGQMSAQRPLGRVTLKCRVHAGTRRFYRWLEHTFSQFGPRQVSFVRYLCIVFLDAWRVPESTVDYAGIYARDGHRCTNPVCRRRGVTPHHLQFRSAGGDDSDENVTSLCWWCHLEGVHGARLTVKPPASAMRWTIGRTGHTTVVGRHRTVHPVPPLR